MRHRVTSVAIALALVATLGARAAAGGGGGGHGGPTAPPGPASQGSAAVTDGILEAGAGGTYLPITPDDVAPGIRDSRNPLTIPPAAPNPQGMPCPATHNFHTGPGGTTGPGVPSGGIIDLVTIYPTFTRNAEGGYDGSDPSFGYLVAGAIPPGGDPTQTFPGAAATSANLAGHIVAVTAYMQTRGQWQDASATPPYGGSCTGATFSFSLPFVTGDAPPPVPPTSVLDTPPFPTGPALLAELDKAWTIGTVQTLPGPATTTPTYVRIPTCAWLGSDVPTAPTPFHTVTTATEGGYTLFLVYNLVVTPGPVTWDWGDGVQTTAAGPVERAPTSLPAYDPTAQTWTDPCQESHAYATVSDGGRVITAHETFTVSITVSWSDGVTVHTAAVPCDAVTGGACALNIGPADGWSSGPHPVQQIEPVPYEPSPAP